MTQFQWDLDFRCHQMSIPRPRNWQKGAGCTGQLPGLGHSRLIFCRLNRPGGNLTIEATTIKRTRPRSPCFVPTPWPTGRRSSLFLTSSKPCFGTLGAQWLKWLKWLNYILHYHVISCSAVFMSAMQENHRVSPVPLHLGRSRSRGVMALQEKPLPPRSRDRRNSRRPKAWNLRCAMAVPVASLGKTWENYSTL